MFVNEQELSLEIDKNHDSYMEFMEQTLDKPDLLAQVTQGLKLQEKHLVYLELMIMEQVADWEIGTGRMQETPGWDKPTRLVCPKYTFFHNMPSFNLTFALRLSLCPMGPQKPSESRKEPRNAIGLASVLYRRKSET